DGNIGWLAAALTPVRKGWDGLLPVPGAKGEYEWQGFLAVKDLPQTDNPPSHWIATANHNILPAGYAHEIAYERAPNYRFRRVHQRLQAKQKFDLDEFKSMQQDSTTLAGQALARLVKRADTGDPALRPYIELLASWDGVLSRESKAGPLYAVWMQELLEELFRPHVPQRLLASLTTRSGVPVLLPALEKPDRFWFGDRPEEERDRLLQRTFASPVTNAD